MYFVYMLVCQEKGRSYVGQTDDLLRRFCMHREGTTRWTREQIKEPYLAYWESHLTRAEAMRRERYFKSGSGHRLKLDLIRSALTASSAG